MSFTFLGSSQLSTSSTFSFSISIPLGPMMTPRNPIFFTFYTHFSGLTYKLFSSNLLIMSFLCLSSYQYIAYKCSNFLFINQVPQDFIHYCLEHNQQVCYSEKHYCWFKGTDMHCKCSLSLIPFLNPHIVEPLP